jgi:hypothetical protein
MVTKYHFGPQKTTKDHCDYYISPWTTKDHVGFLCTLKYVYVLKVLQVKFIAPLPRPPPSFLYLTTKRVICGEACLYAFERQRKKMVLQKTRGTFFCFKTCFKSTLLFYCMTKGKKKEWKKSCWYKSYSTVKKKNIFHVFSSLSSFLYTRNYFMWFDIIFLEQQLPNDMNKIAFVTGVCEKQSVVYLYLYIRQHLFFFNEKNFIK